MAPQARFRRAILADPNPSSVATRSAVTLRTSPTAPAPLLAPLLTLLPVLLTGCYPHTQAYRGAFSGRVVDVEGRPVPGATVVACTSGDAASFAGCPHRAEAWTDPEGRFQFSPVKVRAWCCFGESPLPPTHVTVCARDGLGRLLLASSVTVDASGATEPRLSVSPPEAPSSQSACIAPR